MDVCARHNKRVFVEKDLVKFTYTILAISVIRLVVGSLRFGSLSLSQLDSGSEVVFECHFDFTSQKYNVRYI